MVKYFHNYITYVYEEFGIWYVGVLLLYSYKLKKKRGKFLLILWQRDSSNQYKQYLTSVRDGKGV